MESNNLAPLAGHFIRTCAWLVVLGLCPKMKNHPLGGWIIIVPGRLDRALTFGHYYPVTPITADRSVSVGKGAKKDEILYILRETDG